MNYKTNPGLTFSELLITIVISGILFLFIGYLLLNISKFQTTQTSKVEVERDIQDAKFRIETELRKAKSVSMDALNPSKLDFWTIEVNGSTKTVSKTFELSSNKLWLKNNSVSPPSQELILDGVKSLRFDYFTYGGSVDTTTVVVSLETQKLAIYTSTGPSYAISFSSFVVKCRNIFKRYTIKWEEE
jgi:type II secretory pathway pseudopilin PulG